MLGPLMVDVEGLSLTAADRELLVHPLVGGLTLFTRNYQSRAQLLDLLAEIKALRSPALVVAVDHEGGRVQRFREGFTELPALASLGMLRGASRARATTLAHEHGWLMAAELRTCDIDLSYAPVLDLRSSQSAVIGDR